MRSYGLLAEFRDAEGLIAAARKAKEAGYEKLEAFSQVPVEEVWDILGRRRTWIPSLTFLAGLIGAAGGYAIQYFANVWDYPLNVGGRPLHSWPVFAVTSIEIGILFAALGAGVGMLALNGLPRPHHPVFGVPAFDLASQTRCFLCIREEDRRYDPETARQFLESTKPLAVWVVPLENDDDEG